MKHTFPSGPSPVMNLSGASPENRSQMHVPWSGLHRLALPGEPSVTAPLPCPSHRVPSRPIHSFSALSLDQYRHHTEQVPTCNVWPGYFTHREQPGKARNSLRRFRKRSGGHTQRCLSVSPECLFSLCAHGH